MLLGIDVSSHNPPAFVPWKAARFGFVRVTMGSKGIDEHAYEHFLRARTAGVELLGAYHYLRGDSPGAEQAQHFAARVLDLERQGGPLALAVDVEPLPPPAPSWERGVYAQALASFVEALPIQRPCAVYGSPGYLVTLQLGARVLGCPWWLAHWNVGEPMTPAPLPGWTVHQYAVLGGIDRNRFRGDEAGFREVFGLHPPPLPFDVLGGVVSAVQAAQGIGDSGEDFVSRDEGPAFPR